MQLVYRNSAPIRVAISCLFVFFVFALDAGAQSVGLVLSGGAARGITHIGVIKALEENGVPIDYITGTSMGAIVGGLYSIGYTTDEMISLIKSEDFKRWQTGEIEATDKYFYNRLNKSPYILDLHYPKTSKKSLKRLKELIPSYIVPTHQMNLAFLSLFAGPTAACGGNFDRLMVPFRCTASDIFNKEAINFKSGDLGDAIRASMSFPFMFKPVEVEDRLLYDGGIYNSFPKDIMIDDFKPEYIIGSVTAVAKKYESTNDFMSQMMNLVLAKSDFSLDSGTVFNFNLDGYALWDFTVVDKLVKMGYDTAMAHMSSIKQTVKRTVTKAEIEEKRNSFKSRIAIPQIDTVLFTGVDSLQLLYIQNHFIGDEERLSVLELRDAYFQLIGSEAVSEIIPHAYYNYKKKRFELRLDITPKNETEVNFGGNLSSFSLNQAYLGFSFHRFDRHLSTTWIDAHLGLSYLGANIGGRFDMSKRWLYISPQLVWHHFYFFDQNPTADLKNMKYASYQNEFYGKFAVGFPFAELRGKFEFGVGAGLLNDCYVSVSDTMINLNDDIDSFDNSTYKLAKIYALGSMSTLNADIFPTRGTSFKAIVQPVVGEGLHHLVGASDVKKSELWFQSRFEIEHYFFLSEKMSLGVMSELSYSSRSLPNSYWSAIAQSPRFTPTLHSMVDLNEDFCAQSFMAAGIKPVVRIGDKWQIRLEAYAFAPYRTIDMLDSFGCIYSDKKFPVVNTISQASLVYKLRLASVSAFASYYEGKNSKWFFGVNFGLAIFKEKFLE